MNPRKTYSAELFRSRLHTLGIGEGQLKEWVRGRGMTVPRDYQRLWDCLSGQKVSKDDFIVRLAQYLEIDPAYAVLSAHADRADEPFRKYFLAARDRLHADPSVARGWAELDDATRETIRQIIANPVEARRLVRIFQTLYEGRNR